MTTLTWPEPLHGIACCQPDPWTEPDPECPGWAALEREAA